MKKLIAIIFMLFCIISSVFAERFKGTIYDVSFDGISTEGFVYKILDTETLKEYAKTYPEINKYKGKCIEILKIYLDESQTQDFTTLRIPEEIDGFKVIKVNLGSCSIIKKNEQGYFYPYFYFKTSNLIIPASVISKLRKENFPSLFPLSHLDTFHKSVYIITIYRNTKQRFSNGYQNLNAYSFLCHHDFCRTLFPQTGKGC